MGKGFFESTIRLMRRVPGKAWLAVGCLLVAAFWLQQHDARIRQQAEVQQLRSQTSAEVAALRKQAAQDVKQANVENAKEIAKLEQRRQQAVKQNLQLAAQLARLREQAQIQAGEVATLPISQIVNRVTTQLGLKAGDVAPASKADTAKGAIAHGGTRAAAKDSGCSGALRAPALTEKRSGGHRPPLQQDHAEVVGASTLSPRRGPGQPIAADIAQRTISAPPEKQNPIALPLTSSGARKVEAALVDLNACRAESDIETQQISNCQARAEADEAEVKRLNDSVAGLNRAIEAKDKILDRQSNECKAELRAAKGTFLGRLARLTEHVAVGVAIGVAIGVAVK
jgi:predicted  nucleic acid-binding Zn-ribbon protein